LGRLVHIEEVRRFAKETPAFRAKDVELMVGESDYAHLLLHNLAKRREIHRVTKGWYSVLDDPVVSVFAFKPAYLALQEALSLHGLWEQETNVVLLTPRMVRPGMRAVMGSRVLVRRVKRPYFFGFDYVKYGDFFVPVSDVEKTLIDLVYFGEAPDSEVLSEIKEKATKEKLDQYLKAYPASFRREVGSLLH